MWKEGPQTEFVVYFKNKRRLPFPEKRTTKFLFSCVIYNDTLLITEHTTTMHTLHKNKINRLFENTWKHISSLRNKLLT